MKKKDSKNSTEKAFEVVNIFKANVEVLQKTEQDKAFLKTLEASVRKMDKLEKEIVAMKEKLKTKKSVFEQEKEITLEYIRTAKKIIKKELGKTPKSPKKLKPQKKQKKQIIEIAEETK